MSRISKEGVARRTALVEQIDALTEAAFWAGTEFDEITGALLLSWLEVKGIRYTPDEMAAALRALADLICKSTYH